MNTDIKAYAINKILISEDVKSIQKQKAYCDLVSPVID